MTLTLLNQPAATEPIRRVRVEKVDGGVEVGIVVQLAVSEEQVIRLALHFKKILGWVNRLIIGIILDLYWWEVLVAPWAPVGVTVLVVLALKEILT